VVLALVVAALATREARAGGPGLEGPGRGQVTEVQSPVDGLALSIFLTVGLVGAGALTHRPALLIVGTTAGPAGESLYTGHYARAAIFGTLRLFTSYMAYRFPPASRADCFIPEGCPEQNTSPFSGSGLVWAWMTIGLMVGEPLLGFLADSRAKERAAQAPSFGVAPVVLPSGAAAGRTPGLALVGSF
jgi:hypothetical protein